MLTAYYVFQMDQEPDARCRRSIQWVFKVLLRSQELFVSSPLLAALAHFLESRRIGCSDLSLRLEQIVGFRMPRARVRVACDFLCFLVSAVDPVHSSESELLTKRGDDPARNQMGTAGRGVRIRTCWHVWPRGAKLELALISFRKVYTADRCIGVWRTVGGTKVPPTRTH